MRKAVKIFTDKMETKLKEKDSIYGEQGWLDSDCSIGYLFHRLKEEVTKLDNKVKKDKLKQVDKDTVNIANFAMMISDKVRIKGEENGKASEV